MNAREKLKGVFERFIIWSKDSKQKYPELDELFSSFLQTTSFNVFVIGITTSEDFQPVREICRNADEEYQVEHLKVFISEKMKELNVTTEIDPKDEARLIKYLRLFGDIANNGV